MNLNRLCALGMLAASVLLAQTPKPDQQIGTVDGPELFKQYCAVCHGLDAKGNGPMAVSLKKAPADLTHISARNGGMFPRARVEQIISGNTRAAHGTHEMPVWGPIFSQVDRDQDWGKVR